MAESLCCPPETITTLFIGYTPTQSKKLNQKIWYVTGTKIENTNQWNRTEIPEINPHSYGQSIYDKGGKVKKQQLEMDMEQWTGSKLGKEYVKAVYCYPALFNLCAEYIMWNDRLDEAQAGIKIAGRNINNFRYAADTTLMTESEEELKSLLMKMKEESEKVGLKLNIQKVKIMASSPITSCWIDGETMETVRDFIFLGSKITAAMKLKYACFL